MWSWTGKEPEAFFMVVLKGASRLEAKDLFG
jgi:hypothetical protein